MNTSLTDSSRDNFDPGVVGNAEIQDPLKLKLEEFKAQTTPLFSRERSLEMIENIDYGCLNEIINHVGSERFVKFLEGVKNQTEPQPETMYQMVQALIPNSDEREAFIRATQEKLLQAREGAVGNEDFDYNLVNSQLHQAAMWHELNMRVSLSGRLFRSTEINALSTQSLHPSPRSIFLRPLEELQAFFKGYKGNLQLLIEELSNENLERLLVVEKSLAAFIEQLTRTQNATTDSKKGDVLSAFRVSNIGKRVEWCTRPGASDAEYGEVKALSKALDSNQIRGDFQLEECTTPFKNLLFCVQSTIKNTQRHLAAIKKKNEAYATSTKSGK